MAKFSITSGRINVTDPCYDTDVRCANFNLPAKDGTWLADADHNDEGRCSRLIAFHEHDFDHSDGANWESLPNEVGVDSGQAGIFDVDHYNTGDEDFDDSILDANGKKNFYTQCCNLTIEDRNPYGLDWGALEHGVVSSSGYGDGGYTAECTKDKDGLIVAVRITYLEEEDEPDYYLEEDDADDRPFGHRDDEDEENFDDD